MIFFNPFHINTFEEKNPLLSDPFEDAQSFQTNGIISQLDPNYNNNLNTINFTHNADDIIPNSNEDLEEGSNEVLEEGSNEDLEEEIGRADTLRKNIKRKVLKYSMKFINENITNKKYRIKKIEPNQVENVKVDFEQIFMYKTLGDIFSAKVSSKYTSIIDPENYNKNRIQKLRSSNEKLRNIFDITFIGCLEHFFCQSNKEELNGMKTCEDEDISYKNKEEKKDIINYGKVYKEKVSQSIPSRGGKRKKKGS
jgi:hypothetical protein